MGCLNSSKNKFVHKFANIHFSGPCNRACYFCIGQHMPGVDPINNLDAWPLPGLKEFATKCNEEGIKEVNLTGSDTDPLLYNHLGKLCTYLRENIPGVSLGMRTNGVLVTNKDGSVHSSWVLFDKASISITSFNSAIYKQTMGKGAPPDMNAIVKVSDHLVLKANVVLCPEILSEDLRATLRKLMLLNIPKINLREPYGQPHIGNVLCNDFKWKPLKHVFGMPSYLIGPVTWVTYWDVHYVEVESVNLYANGRVSETYPVSEGHDPSVGKVLDQTNFKTSGRHISQWENKRKLKVATNAYTCNS